VREGRLKWSPAGRKTKAEREGGCDKEMEKNKTEREG
jgi:hypothetical protein